MVSAQPKKFNRPLVQHQCCPSFKAYFRLTQEKRVRVFFPKKHLPLEVRQLHFGEGVFSMSCSIELPSIILLKLGIEYYKIHPGLYPIQEDHDFFKVDL
jgi:hypothetical protein